MNNEDRAGFKRTHGRVFVFEFRTYPCPGSERRILSRGRYEKSEAGEPSFARGIAFDITEHAGHSPDEGCSRDEALLNSAVDDALALFDSIEKLGSAARPSLKPLVELLLHQLGVQLADKQ